ncbi:MAG: hypothetical protein PHE83_17385 [Opitutaceae bacterium]|nr:hypothetical protein [Opitutaceae bacterium]
MPAITDATNAKVHPTLQQLKDAGEKGLIVRNPDNGLIFRAVYATWEGCLHGVKIFNLHQRRPVKSPLMHPDDIETWLSGLEAVPA